MHCPLSDAVPQSNSGPRTALLTWQVVQKKMPWNIILLLGGGFALAKGSEVKCTEKKTSCYTGRLRFCFWEYNMCCSLVRPHLKSYIHMYMRQ